MRPPAIAFALVAAFSAVVGRFLWVTTVGPAPPPEYFTGEGLPVLTGSDAEAKNLYLRRSFHLTGRPEHAYLVVAGRDRLQVFVNGRLAARRVDDGAPVGFVIDLATDLRPGPNAIGIVARQSSVGVPPAVAVDGAYSVAGGPLTSLRGDERWRTSHRLERDGEWWFSRRFRDAHWPSARVTGESLRAVVSVPPRAVTTPSTARWIAPVPENDRHGCVRREFEISERPRWSWLRVTTSAAYRLAVNGHIVDVQDDPLGLGRATEPVRRLYDVTTILRPGRNAVALALTGETGRPLLMADLEIEDGLGRRTRIETDGDWMGASGLPADWRNLTADGPEWQPCLPEVGNLGVPAWLPERRIGVATLPLSERLSRIATEAGVMLVVACLTWLSCLLVSLSFRDLGTIRGASLRAVYVALLPPTLVLAAAILATFDPRIARQDVYRVEWLLLAVGSVPLQWFALLPLCSIRTKGRRGNGVRGSLAGRAAVAFSLIGMMTLGSWLRVREVTVEPLQWDEVENYQATLGVFERGFPSRLVHEDLPVAYVHTSELMFAPTALAALATDNERLVVRFPAVCWSVLTIPLIYLAGREFFTRPAGLIAAALYAVAPAVVAMSNFGRYFSQLQFFTLLAVYALWMTVRGAGPINVRALWGTALIFLAMYLTWEGSALVAVGMAVAALVQRRGRLHTVFGSGAVWGAVLFVAAGLVLQYTHVVLQQSQFLWYGTSLSDLRLRPMWWSPTFEPWYYLWQSGWMRDSLVPMAALAGSAVLAVRHPFRRAVRFVLLIHIVTCLLMTFLLPAVAWRYIHHLVPLTILLAAAVTVALARAVVRLARQPAASAGVRAYGHFGGCLAAAGILALGNGHALRLTELPWLRVDGYEPWVFKFPNLEGPAAYVRERLRPGDVVLATDPFQVRHLMRFPRDAGAPTFLWPASTLQMSATLDDSRALPLDRRDGTPMLPNLDAFEELFARGGRVWYVVQPERHKNQNVPEVTAFLRQHMDVVYEDFEALVLLRDGNHRTARERADGEIELFAADADFLPENHGAVEPHILWRGSGGSTSADDRM